MSSRTPAVLAVAAAVGVLIAGAESVTGYYRDRDAPAGPCALVTWFFTFDLVAGKHIATYKPDAAYEMPPTERAIQDFEALLRAQ